MKTPANDYQHEHNALFFSALFFSPHIRVLFNLFMSHFYASGKKRRVDNPQTWSVCVSQCNLTVDNVFFSMTPYMNMKVKKKKDKCAKYKRVN